MYKQHTVFIEPKDKNSKIWRYLDFTKFVALLDSRSLFFVTADQLDDPFEGKYSKKNVEMRKVVYKKLIPDEQIVKLGDTLNNFSDALKNFTVINSWHLSEYESAAMWKLYLKSGEGVAIQSTYNRLAESFKDFQDDIFIGCIHYIDYETDWLPEGNSFYPFLHKRKSFEHERELRAVFQKIPTADGKLDFSKKIFGKGINIPVNLDTLIERIYISPEAEAWFVGLVTSIINKFNLNKEIKQSSLSEGKGIK